MSVVSFEPTAEQASSESARPLLVVLATDGSHHSVRAGRVIAKLLSPGSAEVRLVTVLEYSIYPYGPSGDPLPDAEQRLKEVHAQKRQATDEIRRVIGETQPDVAVYHRFGNPADELLELIEEWDPDLVVVGRRGMSHVKGLLMGSVSTKLLHHSKAPVLVVS